jgi:hypothetical protein
MKRILVPILLSAVMFTACNKSSMDMQAPSKVDQLLTQLKSEPLFTEYMVHMDKAMKAVAADIDEQSPADTSTIKNKSLSYDEKAKALAFTHANETRDEMKKANDAMMLLLKKYPAITALTNEENKVFYKKAVNNYLSTQVRTKK